MKTDTVRERLALFPGPSIHSRPIGAECDGELAAIRARAEQRRHARGGSGHAQPASPPPEGPRPGVPTVEAPSSSPPSASTERLPSPLIEHYRRAIKDQPLAMLDTILNAAWKDCQTRRLTPEEVEGISDYAQARKDRAEAAKAAKIEAQRASAPRAGPSPRRLGQIRAANKASLPDHIRDGLADCARAVLGVIARACGVGGVCNLRMGAIAHKVGCSVESVRLTLREAERRGHINTVHRRLGPMLNAPNEVTIADEGWRTWIARGLKGAAKRAGAELRTRAQAARDVFRRRKDERAAVAALRAERKPPSLRGAAHLEAMYQDVGSHPSRSRTPKAFGASPESFLQKESPSVASQLQEKDCPSGSSVGRGGHFAAAQRAARKLGLDPESLGLGPEDNFYGTTLDGVAYRWS